MLGRERSQTLEFWYRRKFNLAPNDPRYLDLTLEEMTTEYWAWFYLENPNQDEIEDTDFDIDAVTAAMRDGKDWQDL